MIPRDDATMKRVRCTATNRTGQQCKNTAIEGGTICRMHGANGVTRKAAAEEIQLHEAAKAARMLGLPVSIDPQGALLQELHATAGTVQWLREQLDRRGDDQLTEVTVRGEQPGVWLRLWQQERDRLVKVAAECARAGVEERKVAIVEEHGRVMSQLLRAVLADPELGVSVSVEVQSLVVRKHLGLLSKGELVA